MDRDQARLVFTGANLLFGALFLLLPRLSLRLYGVDPEQNPAAATALRFFGSRNLVLGVMLADDKSADAVLRQVPVVAGADAVACLAGAVTGEVPKRTVLCAALTSAITSAIGWQARD